MDRLAPLLRHWPWVALAASAALLAGAHAFETFGHLPPCTLCLRQREAHWAVLTIAAAGIGLSFTPLAGRVRLLVGLGLVAAFAYSTYMGAFHTGVEWHWWPGPTTCATGGVGGGVSPADMQAILSGTRIQPPACDVALWHFLGLSMAAWNALISLGLLVLSGLYVWRSRTPA
jgi:disulfide bond formation protein DsbB